LAARIASYQAPRSVDFLDAFRLGGSSTLARTKQHEKGGDAGFAADRSPLFQEPCPIMPGRAAPFAAWLFTDAM
jgi:hypothetical protein